MHDRDGCGDRDLYPEELLRRGTSRHISGKFPDDLAQLQDAWDRYTVSSLFPYNYFE